MRLSRRSEYGLRALVDLVRHDGGGPLSLASLADRNRLPPKFLEQIMSTLRHAGIVRTTLGARGGYEMSVDPGQITLGRVIRLLDGALAPLTCVSLRYYEPCSCPDEATCSLRDVMHRRPRLDARDSRSRDARRPGRPNRPGLDRPSWPPRRRDRGAASVSRSSAGRSEDWSRAVRPRVALLLACRLPSTTLCTFRPDRAPRHAHSWRFRVRLHPRPACGHRPRSAVVIDPPHPSAVQVHMRPVRPTAHAGL